MRKRKQLLEKEKTNINYDYNNNKNNKNNKNSKNKLSKVNKVLTIITIFLVIIYSLLFFLDYKLGSNEEDVYGNTIENNVKENVNILLVGTNENLTDTIIYIKYNKVTNSINMMSIPRDTYVNNEYCIGHKINSIYRGKNIIPLIEELENKLDISFDYYFVVSQDLVSKIVDEIGGVEFDVPIDMKYYDPTQDLRIDLKKGNQILNGNQAIQLIRFRKNSDGTGYLNGDIDRVKVSQDFIKAFIKSVLKPENISKMSGLINIYLEETKTNVTARTVLKYIPNISTLNLDNIYSYTAKGQAKYIDELSYFLLDEEDTQKLISDEFK